MKTVRLDPSKLLGFRLRTAQTSAKVGEKIGVKKSGVIKPADPLLSAKVGNKVGVKIERA